MIESHARLWAGEAEVVRAYFESPRRTRASDLVWIERQAFKELVDGVFAMLARHEQGRESLAMVRSEAEHYRRFAALHESLRRPSDAPLDPQKLCVNGDWPENAALRALRAEHVAKHGKLGERALRFTEGGYAVLFAEGARRAGRGGADDAIAAVCAPILEEEREHMRAGFADLADGDLTPREWRLLGEIGAAQLRARIDMRNAQFGEPLAPERIAALCAGACEPIDFEWARLRR